MRGLTAATLLDVWERGRTLGPVSRAFVLLQAACPDVSTDELMSWTVGRRDAHLFTLRERSLGGEMQARTACPACAAPLEMSLRIADLRLPFADPDDLEQSIQQGSSEVVFRLPTLRQLDELARLNDATSAWLYLRQTCIQSRHDSLPDDVLQGIERQMALADPQADVAIDLTCAACRHQWQTPFDIAAFFWREIDAHALRLLREVHQLALAYRWSEADILAMSPWRRSLYLELVGS